MELSYESIELWQPQHKRGQFICFKSKVNIEIEEFNMVTFYRSILFFKRGQSVCIKSKVNIEIEGFNMVTF